MAVNNFLFGAENILIIYLAAQLALDNIFTIGMVFAFITYKQQFINKATLLLEKALDFGIVGLHLERLSDIALTPLEPGHTAPLLSRPIRGAVEVRDVSFRYSDTEDFVLENVNFAIGAGESATIMGPSGCGKTTLMKVMLGLLPPTSGEVFIDGIPLKNLESDRFRTRWGR
jgi:ATP-binding cassette subfamily B protein RaxB